MKKRLITSACIAGIIIILVLVAIYWLTVKSVAFTLVGSDYTVQVRTQSGRTISALERSSTVSLHPGTYLYVIEGEKYDSAAQTALAITPDTTEVTINPAYSQEYLAKLQEQEDAAITSLISSRYPGVSFTLKNLTLYGRGEWASAWLVVQQEPKNIPEVYRTILHQVNDTWVVAAKPAIAIAARNYPDIPKNIVDSLY